MRSPLAAVALRQARQHLLESGQCPDGLLDARLARSWQRSLQGGLLPTGRLGSPDNLERQALRQLGQVVCQPGGLRRGIDALNRDIR